MKKYLLLTAAVLFFIGCAEKPLAKNVIELAGNKKVAGWNDSNDSSLCKPKVIVKEVVKLPSDSDNDGVPDIKDKCPNTPKNLTVDHNGCPVISRLYIIFDFNKAKVKKIYYPEIKKVAKILKANPHLKVEVAGHTDNIGSAEYNLKLSYKRAKAVRDLLVKFGVDKNRMVVKGYGEKYPLVPNTTPTNRALNRRVEIVALNGYVKN